MDSYLIENFKKFDSKLAIIHNDKKYTYKELLEKIEEFLNEFTGKIKKRRSCSNIRGLSF